MTTNLALVMSSIGTLIIHAVFLAKGTKVGQFNLVTTRAITTFQEGEGGDMYGG